MTSISVRTSYIAPGEEHLPALGVQITRLVDSYMVWVGVATKGPDAVEDAPRSGSLCKDWACAMPPASSSKSALATTLYRTSSSDMATSMAQRLAKRVHKTVFLSLDVPANVYEDAEKAVLLLLLQSY